MPQTPSPVQPDARSITEVEAERRARQRDAMDTLHAWITEELARPTSAPLPEARAA